MDLIEKEDSKYTEYEELLLERDQTAKEAAQIRTMYLRQFGPLIDGKRITTIMPRIENIRVQDP